MLPSTAVLDCSSIRKDKVSINLLFKNILLVLLLSRYDLPAMLSSVNYGANNDHAELISLIPLLCSTLFNKIFGRYIFLYINTYVYPSSVFNFEHKFDISCFIP